MPAFVLFEEMPVLHKIVWYEQAQKIKWLIFKMVLLFVNEIVLVAENSFLWRDIKMSSILSPIDVHLHPF